MTISGIKTREAYIVMAVPPVEKTKLQQEKVCKHERLKFLHPGLNRRSDIYQCCDCGEQISKYVENC